MNEVRNGCTGLVPVHFFKRLGGAAAGLVLAATPFSPAQAQQTAATAAAVASRPQNGQSVEDFYRARKDALLWYSPTAGDAAQQLITLLGTATFDGFDPRKYLTPETQELVQAARSGKRKHVERADKALSIAYAAYVADVKRDPGVGITYVDPGLRPAPPTPLAALLEAAAQPSLGDYLRNVGWMHPFYGQLRGALAEHKYSDDRQRELIQLNLQRARALPASRGKYVLVNAAQQRLYMYDGGKPVDSMVVVVGKPKWPTPMLTAYIRFAALNPYWYVPPDLAGEDVGQYVTKFGLKYLDDYGYEIVSDWTRNPAIIDPKTVDWKGVNDGTVNVMIRQKPGPKNFMGRVKFMFPNQFGVYLHDNPRRELFKESTRYFSGGCVRLEDAWRLSKWLFGRDLTWEGAAPEEPVMLNAPVPVYITYLTAMPDGEAVAYYDDAYGRDAPKLAATSAQGDGSSVASR
ncbi:L,D-transpeptidase family protein [Sphingomonas sp. URHD0057]|uniref:L,D-transpeptidase family protein n=1 Tax=Sphingomonas sp. URHD0057 TaxID=1380389 RepID=UPI000687C95D|nr:L,D-transpeptidase family protein [Sphingomonas sp. URHD0057]